VTRGARRALAGAGVAVAAALALAPALPAAAHNYIVSSTPEEGATLTELPDVFQLTTNEPLLDVDGQGTGFAMQVRDAEGGSYGDACPEVSGATLSVPAPQLGASGDYEVLYQFVSADGHTVSGEVPFTWEAPDGWEPAAASDAPAACGGADAESPGSGGEAGGQPAEDGDAALGDLLWIGGAALAVVAAVVATLVVLGRRRPAESAGAPDGDDAP
jgi:copper resistance protein C